MGTETEIAAGRELDVLIATEVMGWTKTMQPKNGSGYLEEGIWSGLPEGQLVARINRSGGLRSDACFSTTYEGMGLVLERMRELGWEWSISSLRWTIECESGWEALVTYGYNGISSERTGVGNAGTLPHAVCLAALKAVRSVASD